MYLNYSTYSLLLKVFSSLLEMIDIVAVFEANHENASNFKSEIKAHVLPVISQTDG